MNLKKLKIVLYGWLLVYLEKDRGGKYMPKLPLEGNKNYLNRIFWLFLNASNNINDITSTEHNSPQEIRLGIHPENKNSVHFLFGNIPGNYTLLMTSIY
jgi:hypothetical protein